MGSWWCESFAQVEDGFLPPQEQEMGGGVRVSPRWRTGSCFRRNKRWVVV